MDVVVIFNGLGNQMSQYAFFLQKKSIKTSTNFILNCKTHNGLDLNKAFNIGIKENLFQIFLYVVYRLITIKPGNPISKPIKLFFAKLGFKEINENFDYRFNKEFLTPKKGVTFYTGGWHSEKYHICVKELVANTYQFIEPDDHENINNINSIVSTNSVSVHVRRGDYLTPDNYQLFGEVCDENYFKNAIALITSKISNPHFFVFSNDILWVRENLKFDKVTYITCNEKQHSWKDMFLMSMCKHNIISNSTFSWWAAWLNKNTRKIVISPDRFLRTDIQNNIYPDSWIKLSGN